MHTHIHTYTHTHTQTQRHKYTHTIKREGGMGCVSEAECDSRRKGRDNKKLKEKIRERGSKPPFPLPVFLSGLTIRSKRRQIDRKRERQRERENERGFLDIIFLSHFLFLTLFLPFFFCSLSLLSNQLPYLRPPPISKGYPNIREDRDNTILFSL